MSKKRQCVECAICTDAVSSSKLVTCPFCEGAACKACTKRFLVESPDDPSCMHCRKGWTREIMTTLFSATWLNGEYKRHREDVLLDREKSMLAETMPLVEAEKARREARKQLGALQEERRRLYRLLDDVQRRMHGVQRQIDTGVARSGDEERRSFLQRCPCEGCRGWLSSAYKCTSCDRYACPKCLMPTNGRNDDGHVCVAADVASVEMIRAESTPCPSCGTRITRTEGCSHMWCTLCQTSFCYITGRKLNGAIHNPHYFEYQRNAQRTLRDNADIPCGGMPGHLELRAKHAPDSFYQVVRVVRHIEDWERRRYNINAADNQHLRISYILDELGDADFKKRLQKTEKVVAKNREIWMIFEMLVNTLTDELRQFVQGKCESECEDAIAQLINYANGAFARVGTTYTQVAPRVMWKDRTIRIVTLCGKEVPVFRM
tara:strand:+ start:384 stop:1682 length:1299 start_codon:yes stop_codon:yes gene_type:complete